MEQEIKKKFQELIATAKTKEAIEVLLSYEAIKKEYFNEIVALKNQIRQLKRNNMAGTIDISSYNMNHNRIVSSLMDIVDEFERSKNYKPEDILIKNKDKNTLKEFIYKLIAEDKIKDSIYTLKAWVIKNEKNSTNVESDLSLLSSQLTQIVNNVRLGIINNSVYSVERSKVTQKLLVLLEVVIRGNEKKIEKIKAEEKLERTAASFVQDSIMELSRRESSLKLQANIWYIAGFVALALGVIVGVYFSSSDSTVNLSTVNVIYVVARNVLIIALLVFASRYSFNLGKTYMNEFLKNADRIHAISFGKFYLQVYGSNIKQEDLKDVFKDWNTSKESAFLKLDSNEIDPKILESILKIAESMKK